MITWSITKSGGTWWCAERLDNGNTVVLSYRSDGLRIYKKDGVCIRHTTGIAGHGMAIASASSVVVANLNGPFTGNEGSPIPLTVDIAGSTGSSFLFSWDFDRDEAGWDIVNDPTKQSVDPVYDDNGEYRLMVNVTDEDHPESTDTAEANVTVYNVPPTIESVVGPEPYPIPAGTAIEIGTLFDDPGILDMHELTIDWGDDVSQTFDVTGVDSMYFASHTYSSAGTYWVAVTVCDDDGGCDAATLDHYVVVYDPTAGFVTGGGWIDSPAGAYLASPDLVGKANFGFVSKYKKGATTPTGNTQFVFRAASLNFHSSEYDWLVIAGPKAMYKGTGKIFGRGNYGFILSAIDSSLTTSTDKDLFRIKIWDKDNGDAVVYDNNVEDSDEADPTTEISGGSIMIHKN